MLLKPWLKQVTTRTHQSFTLNNLWLSKKVRRFDSHEACSSIIITQTGVPPTLTFNDFLILVDEVGYIETPLLITFLVKCFNNQLTIRSSKKVHTFYSMDLSCKTLFRLYPSHSSSGQHITRVMVVQTAFLKSLS